MEQHKLLSLVLCYILHSPATFLSNKKKIFNMLVGGACYQRVGTYYNLLRKFDLLNVMLFFGKLYFYNYLTEKKISILPIIRENITYKTKFVKRFPRRKLQSIMQPWGMENTITKSSLIHDRYRTDL